MRELPTDLSLYEIAILSFSNESSIDIVKNKEQQIILTTKFAYLWSVTIAYLIEHNQHITIDDITAAYEFSIEKNKNRINEYYKKIYDFTKEYDISTHFKFHKLFLDYFGHSDDTIIYNLSNKAKSASRSLENRGLIEDPIFTSLSGTLLSIIGFIPYSFTQKTKNGEIVYQELKSLMWSYKKTNDKEIKTIEVKLNLMKILDRFKKVLADTMAEKIE